MAQLTGKPRPRLLYLPTARRLAPGHHQLVPGLFAAVGRAAPPDQLRQHQQARGWTKCPQSVDGIVCSGGNTLNQQVIWKAHGIDAILRQAWDRGTCSAAPSAGSLCWFEEGTTDSRPKELDGAVPGL
ncbi:MAG: Type 1 glutamine amidotransferase-like domain-containing protein [Vicinamibacterales bacterium]